MDTESRRPNGPGWPMERVAVLLVIGIATGAAIGIATVHVVAGAGMAAGMIAGGAVPTGSDLLYYVLAVAVAGTVGAVLATAAAVGAMLALVLFDHWGERPPRYRAVTAGLGGAAASTVLLLVAGAPGMAGRLDWWVVVIGGAASGIAAGGGLYLFERRMRERHAPRSGTVEGDFGGHVPSCM